MADLSEKYTRSWTQIVVKVGGLHAHYRYCDGLCQDAFSGRIVIAASDTWKSEIAGIPAPLPGLLANKNPIMYTSTRALERPPSAARRPFRREFAGILILLGGSGMRAVIRCRTNVEPEALDALLSKRDWWPAVPQDHELVEERKRDILNQVKEGDRDIAEGTHLYTIYDAETRSWGIISNPTKRTITFRLKNPVSDRLKAATEKLIYDFQVLGENNRKPDGMLFEFFPTVEVLEPNSQNHAFSGVIIPAGTLKYAIDKRTIEAAAGLIAALFAAMFSLLTIPSARSLLFNWLSPEWFTWLSGFLERLATSAIVVATISWLNLLLYWLDLRQRGVVRWSLD